MGGVLCCVKRTGDMQPHPIGQNTKQVKASHQSLVTDAKCYGGLQDAECSGSVGRYKTPKGSGGVGSSGVGRRKVPMVLSV